MIRSALLVALTATTVAAQGFEGGITMTLTSDNGKATEMTYLMKGGKIRMDVPGQGAMIVDGSTKKMQMLMTQQKMYIEMDVSSAAAAATGNAKPATVARTGRMETIAGYQCEHLTITEDGGATSDVCAATGLGAFMMPSSGRGGPPMAQGWEAGLRDGGFPLKVTKGGKVIQEVTKIDKKSLDAALFTVPDGFTKFDMPGMGRRGGG
jgi:hypothetical protein